MNKEFDSLGQLLEEVRADKQSDGVDSGMRNRYPIRFVLFDDFVQSKAFVSELIAMGVSKMGKIAAWISANYPDLMLTYSELSDRISRYIEESNGSDCVIMPFSELARFYDEAEFKSLVGTIKGIQQTKQGFANNQRVYVPLIGQMGKMTIFEGDTQCTIWHCKSEQERFYKLILTQSTYGVKGLPHRFSLVSTMTEWLELWRDEKAKEQIICTSRSIHSCAPCAQPDNAFSYVVCNNAYEFLTKGLHLDFGNIGYKEEDANHWEFLASYIDYESFSFEKFFNKYFEIYSLNDVTVFAKTWFGHTDNFSRWLLSTYYSKRFCQHDYVCKVLQNIRSYTNQEFIATAALYIFQTENPITYIEERKAIIEKAVEFKIDLSIEATQQLKTYLERIEQEKGAKAALPYVTHLTNVEKELLIKWVGQGKTAIDEIEKKYPALFHYMESYVGLEKNGTSWLTDYIDAYKKAKLGNKYTSEIMSLIKEVNKDEVSFFSWYNAFKTVRSELDNCNDIDVYYWIDGLGIDWIPFIKWKIDTMKNEGIFVNNIIMAHALLPTTTERNKPELYKLAGGTLSKKGDLDSFAHICTRYPYYIVREMEIVEKAVEDIVHEHAGRKIAIVSDHGLSYLSQLCNGYNLGGLQSDHFGRIGLCGNEQASQDHRYIKLDNGKTLCALRHESLCIKTPYGQGCHGGCTPEEVLVPIFILSSRPKNSDYIVSLVDNEISGTNPRLWFSIKGDLTLDVPKLIYNDKGYNLTRQGGDKFVSDKLLLVQGKEEAEIRIGTFSQVFKIKLKLGAEENDLGI